MISRTFYISTVIFLCSCNQQKNSSEDRLLIEAIAVPLHDTGWSYEVYVDHKLFIKQQFIPAIHGYHAFATEKDALSTARLVVDKIKKGKPPGITEKELQTIGISGLSPDKKSLQ